MSTPLNENLTTKRNLSLDALRGIFAIGVVYSHIALIRYYFGLEENGGSPLVSQLGRIGVTGFFVLSGFLITVNLLKEKEEQGNPGAKAGRFYLKRILRIWPLYYTVILLSIFVFPYVDALRFTLPAFIQDARQLPQEHIYYYLLVPQIPLAKSVVLPFAEPTWSIGVEEIFYLLVPVLLFFSHVKKNLLLIIGVLFVLAKYALYYTIISNPAEHPVAAFYLALLELSRFECILLGCYIGYLYKKQHPLFLRLNYQHVIAAVVLLLIAAAMVQVNTYQYYHFAVCFAVIILYAAKMPLPLLNNRLLAFVGKISFSLYMTHEIAIVFLHNNAAFMEQAEATPPLFLYVIIPLAAIVVATASYYIIERPFLLLKSKVK